MSREIKLKINGQEDRRTIVAILAENGYEVVVEKKEDIIIGDDHFVIIKIKNY